MKKIPLITTEEAEKIESKSPEDRIKWATEKFGEKIILSSSFGAQSAVMLHLCTQVWSDIPVVFIDTGYLFPETYRFVDELKQCLSLNLKTYRSPLSPAWQEARFGKLWEQNIEGINQYNQINKVEPMQRALEDLKPKIWLAGLRRQQATSRKKLSAITQQGDILKLHPIIEWTDKDIYLYLKKFDLPYHPLWEQGFVSIGDIHTTRKLTDDITEEETRFFGLKRECGLHDEDQWKGDYVI